MAQKEDTCTESVTVGTMPMTLGCGAALATIQGVFDYGGGKFSGYDKDPNVDEFERKEFLRKNRRKPIQEILGELGEGGGTQSTNRL